MIANVTDLELILVKWAYFLFHKFSDTLKHDFKVFGYFEA